MERKTTGLFALVPLALLFIIIGGCTGTIPGQPGSPTVGTTPVVQVTTTAAVADTNSTPDVAGANNRFAFDLYSRLAKDPANTGSNIFFSPFSISSALAITYEGANGKTADEIRSVLHFPPNDTTLRAGYSDLNAGINRGDTSYSLQTANALWAEKTYPFLPGYISTAQQYYGSKYNESRL